MDEKDFLWENPGTKSCAVFNGLVSEKVVTETKYKGITALTVSFCLTKILYIYLCTNTSQKNKVQLSGSFSGHEVVSGKNGIEWRHRIMLQLLLMPQTSNGKDSEICHA